MFCSINRPAKIVVRFGLLLPLVFCLAVASDAMFCFALPTATWHVGLPGIVYNQHREDDADPDSISSVAARRALLQRRVAILPLKIRRYAKFVISRYDSNGDGKLSPEEWAKMRGQPQLIDYDRDTFITEEEYMYWIYRYAAKRRISPASALRSSERESSSSEQDTNSGAESSYGRQTGQEYEGKTYIFSSALQERYRRFYVPPTLLPDDLPSWFREADVDGDGQISFAEYKATRGSVSAFQELDRDGDGVLTTSELGYERYQQSVRKESHSNGSENSASDRKETLQRAKKSSHTSSTGGESAGQPVIVGKASKSKYIKRSNSRYSSYSARQRQTYLRRSR